MSGFSSEDRPKYLLNSSVLIGSGSGSGSGSGDCMEGSGSGFDSDSSGSSESSGDVSLGQSGEFEEGEYCFLLQIFLEFSLTLDVDIQV